MSVQAFRLEREIEERNRPLSDEELDAMLPSERLQGPGSTCRVSFLSHATSCLVLVLGLSMLHPAQQVPCRMSRCKRADARQNY